MTAPTAKPKARRPKVPKPLERDVQKRCIEIMESGGWIVYRRNVGAFKVGNRYIRAAESGQSDTYGFIPGRDGQHVECEIKRPGERPTLEQVEWLLRCHRANAVAFWVSSAERCREVMRHVNAGGDIVYGGMRKYPLVDKSGKKIGDAWGPSGDYELVDF